MSCDLISAMTTPQARVEQDIKAALKGGEKERLSTLRMLLAELKNEKIAAGAEVDETRFTAVLRKMIKQRHDSAAQYKNGGRPESAAQEESEAALLGSYLPAQVDEDTVRRAIRDFVAAEGLSGPAAMGRVMKEILARFGTQTDGATVSKLAREILSS